MTGKGFAGLRVMSFESRRQREMGQLIVNNGGRPVVVASTREVPIDSNPEVASFVSGLLAGQFDAVIFLTGVGTRTLAQAADTVCPRERLVESLGRTAVIARGPKPIAALRELGVPVTLSVPEPNTWREILRTLDENADKVALPGRRIAVQEYGAPSTELLAGLSERGALVTPIHVYQWAQPEDKGPLREAVKTLIQDGIDVVMFTSQVQLLHLIEVAEEMKLREEVVQALNRAVVASIGPITSEALRAQGVGVDLDASHPKMGFLVKEAAEQSAALITRKKVRA
jgi:uroporphyrinogen-III synthase